MFKRTNWDNSAPNRRGELDVYVIRLPNGSYARHDLLTGDLLSEAYTNRANSFPNLKESIIKIGYLRGASIVRLSRDGWPGEVEWTDTRDSDESKGKTEDMKGCYWVWHVGEFDKASSFTGLDRLGSLYAWLETQHSDVEGMQVRVCNGYTCRLPLASEVDVSRLFVVRKKPIFIPIDQEGSPIELPEKS